LHVKENKRYSIDQVIDWRLVSAPVGYLDGNYGNSLEYARVGASNARGHACAVAIDVGKGRGP
jgi:hypothetical protein